VHRAKTGSTRGIGPTKIDYLVEWSDIASDTNTLPLTLAKLLAIIENTLVQVYRVRTVSPTGMCSTGMNSVYRVL